MRPIRSTWETISPQITTSGKSYTPGDGVEGLVDCMVRGGSNPLGRTREAPHSGAFSMSGRACRFRPRMDVLSHDKYVYFVRPNGPRDNAVEVLMSVSFHRGGWEARWRDAPGRQCRTCAV
jgi:hypothetical protein